MPNTPRILLVENDAVLAASLAEQLTQEGYQVVCASDEDAALQAARNTAFAFAIISLGEECLAHLRQAGLVCPVLLLVEGEAPSPEMLAKPFRFSALMARLHKRLS